MVPPIADIACLVLAPATDYDPKFKMGGMVETREYMFSRSSACRVEVVHDQSYITGGMWSRDSPATSKILKRTVRSMLSAVSCQWNHRQQQKV